METVLGWPGTWTAKPRSIQRPIVWLDSASSRWRPASPPLCAGCVPGTRVPPLPDAPSDCRTPLSKYRCCIPLSRLSGRSTTMLSKVSATSLVSWTLAPATTTLNGPPPASTKMLRLLSALPRSVGLRPTAPPQNGPCPWRNRQPIFPSQPHSVRRTLPPGWPRCPPAPQAPPSAERCGEWCCRPPMPGAGQFTAYLIWTPD